MLKPETGNRKPETVHLVTRLATRLHLKFGALRRSGLLLATLPFASVLSGSAQEFRATWADVFHVGMGSQAEVNTMVSTLVTGHYNAVVVQVLGYMDSGVSSHGAHWKSSILPWSTRVTASFDPLAYLCTQAHANGIEVHAWVGGSGGAMYRVSTTWPPAGNATLAAHPQWFMAPLTNSEANAIASVDSMYILDLGSPDAQEYVVSIVRELVTNYPIDGINWDDEINGAGYNAGFGYPTYSQANYPRSGLARYRINTGVSGTPSNTATAWADYRRRYKNELMARVQAEIQSIKTNPRQPLRHTSAALAYSPVPSSCTFSGSAPYTYFCDWAGMLQHGWVDAVIPQTYSSSTFNTWADRASACWQYNRQIFPGIGAYLNPDATIASEITYTRSKGLKGNCIYSYAVANNSSPYNGDWWAYAATNVYTNVVSTPLMTWRNPATATEGIVWGRVTDANTGLYVDDATVTVTGGPTVKTDGNGYYVATLVPATAGGTAHSTTASKTGMTSQTTNAIALPGDIARYDLVLNAAVITAPSITTQPKSQTVNQGNSATFSVAASGTTPLYYQWRWYGTNLAGATGTSLALTAVTTNQSGPYSVAVTNAYGTTTSQVATLTVNPPYQAGSLSLLWRLAPGARTYLTVASTPNERGLAYNAVNRHVLLVSRTSPMVYVLDGDTGADLWTLNKTGVTGGYSTSYYLLMVGAADDGAVYAGNLTLAGNTTAFKLYRWANDGSTTVPTVAYSGDPGAGVSQRWGDTLDVRGAGTNTQAIIGSRNTNIVAVLTTADGTNFTSHLITVADAPPGAFGLGIAFGASNTFWGKATSQNLRQVSFDLAAGTGTTVRNYADPAFPASVAPLGVSTDLNLLGGLNVGVTGNNFRLYDLTATNGTPGFITATNFATDNDNTGTGTGAIDFSGDRVYALGANNGIIALQIIPAVVNTAPAITAQPQGVTAAVGSNVTFTVTATGTLPLSYQWRFNGTNLDSATGSAYTCTNAQAKDAGSYAVVVSNVAGILASADAVLAVTQPSPPQIDSISFTPNGRFQLQVSGDPGHYAVEAATNLVDWAELTNFITTSASFQYLDTETNLLQRFYRIRLVQ